MKKFTLFLALIFFMLALHANSQVILDENFSYPVGDTLGSHGWGFINSSVNPLTVASGNLTYAGYVNSGIGNYVRLHNNGEDEYTGFTPVTSGSLYASFLVSIDSSQANGGDYFAALLPSTSTTNYTARLYAKDTTSGMVFGITKGAFATNPVVYSTATFQHGVTYLAVIRYIFNTGTTTDDSIYVYILSSGVPSTEPTTPTIRAGGVATDAADLGRFAIRQGSAAVAPTLWIDGIRICSSWSNIPTALSNISTTTPVNYSLRQNYPNPFNPVTNIEFDVKKSSYVTLKVYDIMGREVTTLVNNNLQAGTFRASFSANNYSSGVYYYKLIALDNMTGEKFVNTKAMVLVK